MADYDTDLLKGIAVHLAAQGFGAWSETGVYADGLTGIVVDATPQSPAFISLSTYAVSDDPSQAVNVTGLQIRNRAGSRDPRDAREAGADIFADLHGRTHWDLSTGLRVTQILRTSATTQGPDENGRWSRVQNFYCNLHVPSMNTWSV